MVSGLFVAVAVLALGAMGVALFFARRWGHAQLWLLLAGACLCLALEHAILLAGGAQATLPAVGGLFALGAAGFLLRGFLLLDPWMRLEAFEHHALHTSRIRARRLIDIFPEAVLVCNLDGRILDANVQAARLHGYETPTKLIESEYRCQDFVSPIERDRMNESMRKLVRESWPRYASYTGIRRDGEQYPLELSRALLRDENSEPGEIVVVLRDVSDKHEAEMALREERDFNRTLIESSPVFYVAIDGHGKILMVNSQILKATGYRSEEVVGANYLDVFVPEEERGLLEERFQDLIRMEKPTLSEGHILTRDGNVLLAEWHGRSVWKSEGEIAYFFGIGIDITERRRLEQAAREHAEELETLNRELERRNRELDEFTRMSSHDLQEPARKQLMFTRVLRDSLGDDLDENARFALNAVENAASRMQSLVQDLLSLSRSRRQLLRPEQFDLEESVDIALDILDDVIKNRKAKIYRDPMPVVHGDRELLAQLFQNLVGNAIKFSSGDTPEVYIRAVEEEGRWVIGVEDNGIGIGQDDLQAIFSAFKRLHTRAEYDGSGIGLAICRRIVERHDGAIWVESKPGKGAHFKFTLGWTPSTEEGTTETHAVTEAAEDQCALD